MRKRISYALTEKYSVLQRVGMCWRGQLADWTFLCMLDSEGIHAHKRSRYHCICSAECTWQEKCKRESVLRI